MEKILCLIKVPLTANSSKMRLEHPCGYISSYWWVRWTALRSLSWRRDVLLRLYLCSLWMYFQKQHLLGQQCYLFLSFQWLSPERELFRADKTPKTAAYV